MQRAQAAEARAEAVTAQSRQQRSHPLHAEAQLEEAPASFGDAASMQDTSLMYSLTDAQLISQVDCPAVGLCGILMLNMQKFFGWFVWQGLDLCTDVEQICIAA